MAVKRYKLTRQTGRRGMGTGPLEQCVIEVEEGTQPIGAEEVTDETPLSDWVAVQSEQTEGDN